MIAKILIWWGCSIFGLLYLAFSVATAADAFVKGGWGALALEIVLFSAMPSWVAGTILYDPKV